LNNPLVYTDPSGEWLHLIAGAVIGGITNLMMNANNIHNFWQGLGYFGVGAASGALGAGVGAGISSAIAGGSFGAGFVGSSAAMTATSSFISGAAIGGGAGFSAGFVSGLGNGLMNGQKFDKALGQGTVYGLIGGGSGALLGGIAGGIDAARDDRRFWDGATVTKRYAADVSIVPVKQEGLNNCLPASGESVNKSLGGNITQNDFRAKAGGDPNLNPINEEYFWKDIYVNETGHTVKSYSAQNYGRFGAGQIAPELNSGGRVAVTIYGAENIEHSVVVKSVYFQTVTKVNGTATRTWMFRVMDPATGGFRNIPQNKLINVFIIKP
jgi:hypothetical protein